MAQTSKTLSPGILDEVWTLMKCATVPKKETGPKEETCDDFLQSMPEHFRWECSVTLAGGEDDKEKPDDDKMPKTKHDVIHEAADQLAEMGDKYCEKKDGDKLINDITKYLTTVARDIDDKLDDQLSMMRPPESVFMTGVVSLAYNAFQSKLQNFLGLNKSVDRIAIVTHVAKGVASGLESSSLPAVHLVSALAYKFVTDSYQNVLEEHGSVTKLMKSAKESESTD